MKINLRGIERILIVELASRVALYAVLAANAVKAWHVLAQWMDGATAAMLSIGIEVVLMIGIHMITDRRVYNATKTRKTDPDKIIGRPLVASVLFFGMLSAVANVAYLIDHGAGWMYGVLFGVAAPLAAAFVAYLTGDESAVERRLAEFEQNRADKSQARRATRTPQTKARARQDSMPDYAPDAPAPAVAATPDKAQISRDLGNLPDETQDQIRRAVQAYSDNPNATLEDLSGVLGVSRSRAGEVRRYAVEGGALRKNGRLDYEPVNGRAV